MAPTRRRSARSRPCFHDGEAIGRAVVGADGTATITPDVQTNADDLTVSLDQDGALPVQKEVEGVPTSLTITGPSSVNLTGGSENRTFSGHLDPPAANAPIRVVYTSETGSPNAFPPITHNTTTNANGDWSDDWTSRRASSTSERGARRRSSTAAMATSRRLRRSTASTSGTRSRIRGGRQPSRLNDEGPGIEAGPS